MKGIVGTVQDKKEAINRQNPPWILTESEEPPISHLPPKVQDGLGIGSQTPELDGESERFRIRLLALRPQLPEVKYTTNCKVGTGEVV